MKKYIAVDRTKKESKRFLSPTKVTSKKITTARKLQVGHHTPYLTTRARDKDELSVVKVQYRRTSLCEIPSNFSKK